LTGQKIIVSPMINHIVLDHLPKKEKFHEKKWIRQDALMGDGLAAIILIV